MDNANLVKQLKEALGHYDAVFVDLHHPSDIKNMNDAKDIMQVVIKQLELGIDDGK